MKIVCESCGAKYSIADDRISGKVFKIRCKRCSEVIIVRGDQQTQAGTEQAEPAGHDQSAIWHVVVDGEQAGPYAPPQLAELLGAGTVDWEAYVWTEGFDNWLPMRDVPDLVAQITGESAPAQQPAAERASSYRAAVQETLTGQPSMGADPFADDAPSDGGLFGGGGSAGGADLFAGAQAQSAASPFAGSAKAGVVTSAQSPRVDAAQAMTGARNENSVLFSLKNLQALATGGAGTPASASMASGASAVSGGRDGYASGEGSGLIDIRALASTTGVGESGQSSGSRDELLSIGSQGGAFGTLGSPMLSPARTEPDGNKNVLVWAAVAGVGVLSLAAVAIVFIMREPAASAPPVAVSPQAPSLTATAPSAPPEGVQAEDSKPSEGELAANANRGSEDERQEGRDEASQRAARDRDTNQRRRQGSSDNSGSNRTQERSPSPSPSAAEKPAPPKPSGPRSIDDLLEGALSGSAKSAPAEASAAKSNLPDQPSRDQVISAMTSVKGAVSSCAKGGQGGVATVTVSVAGSTGRVTNATVSGVTGPTGSCVAQAVRKARFPKFQSKVFKVQFPFKL